MLASFQQNFILYGTHYEKKTLDNINFPEIYKQLYVYIWLNSSVYTSGRYKQKNVTSPTSGYWDRVPPIFVSVAISNSSSIYKFACYTDLQNKKRYTWKPVCNSLLLMDVKEWMGRWVRHARMHEGTYTHMPSHSLYIATSGYCLISWDRVPFKCECFPEIYPWCSIVYYPIYEIRLNI
jgi:hypothetical protein